MPKMRIDEVYPKKELFPMTVSFQNGYLSEDFRTEPCYLFTNDKTENKSVVSEISDIIYAGDEDEEPLGKTMILARNKKSGKVRLIEVGRVQLKPVLKFDSEAVQLLETNTLELSRKFGSKKQRQKMEHKEKLKVNVDTVTEQMQNVTEKISEDKLDLTSYNKSDSDDFYVPPMDKTADKPENVYDINNILTEELFDKIYSELEEKNYKDDFSKFIKYITSDKQLTKKQTVLAVYADYVLKVGLTAAKDLSRKNYVACPHSTTLNDVILANFTTMHNGRRGRPMPYKDKSLCHVIVFALLINNLKFPLDVFCADAKLTPTTATTKVKVTGASIVTNGTKKIVQLKIPLSTKGGFKRRMSTRF